MSGIGDIGGTMDSVSPLSPHFGFCTLLNHLKQSMKEFLKMFQILMGLIESFSKIEKKMKGRKKS